MKVHTKLLAIPVGLVLLLAACSSGEEKFPRVAVVSDSGLQAVINNSEITVGQNRLVIFFLLPEGPMLVDAGLHLVFYELNSDQAVVRFESDAISVVPARDAGIEEQIDHVHADGSRHVHVSVNEHVGFYTAAVDFDKAGNWGVEMQIASSEPEIETVLHYSFTVIPEGMTPAIGAPAPRSDNLTLADVADIAAIDSAAAPDPALHAMSIADAIEARRPALVLFSTPGFCQLALCGPEYEIMRKLRAQQPDAVEFIHVEVFKDPATREVVDTMQEWSLRSEPWFFLIDADGRIAAKFEGPASLQELKDALKQVAP